MTHDNTHIQVFISCPGDVKKEKAQVRQICDRVSRIMLNNDCRIFFEVKDWQDITGEYGKRPQGIINDTINAYDIYLGVFHMRFGSPTHAINPETNEDYGSGTYEEFKIASQRKADNPDSLTMYLFFKKARAPKGLDEVRQLEKVMLFQNEVGAQNWVNSFKKTEDFSNQIYDILTSFAMQICLKKKGLLVNETLSLLKEKSEAPIDKDSLSKDAKTESVNGSVGRTITSLKKLQSRTAEWFIEKSFSDPEVNSLGSTVLQQKRVVLLGNAGSGKSTELAKLVVDCREMTLPFIPVYRRFNIYVDQSIETFLPEGWQEIPPEICLVILDGLDEVQPQHFLTAVRNIQFFAESHPSLHLVVSCRTNFYALPDTNSTGTLAGFAVFFLDNVTVNGIVTYAKDRIAGADDFVHAILQEGYRDLVGIPFFLEALLQSYQRNGSLSNNRKELFEFIVQSRITGDEAHFQTTISLQQRRTAIITVLERVALVMEAMGSNVINLEQLQQVLTPTYMNLLQYFPAFGKVKNNDVLWGFEHNNIQEYLAARALVSQSLDAIQQLILIPGKRPRLKQSWVNTLSFLISLSDTALLNPLLEWLVSVEPESVVRFEPARVPANVRKDIFLQIYYKAKSRGIWIRSSKFSEEELARFGESPEVFNFLIKELEEAQNDTMLVNNILRVIRYFHLDATQKEQLFKILLQLVARFPNEFNLLHVLLYTTRDQLAKNNKVVETMMDKLGKYTNQYVRAGMYALLLESNLLDRYVDYLIAGVTISQVDGEGQRQAISLADESWNLQSAFKKITEPQALKKVIAFFANPYDRRSTSYYDRNEVVQEILNNAVEAFEQDDELYQVVFHLLLLHARHSTRREIKHILPFFDQTGTRLRAFQDIWKMDAPNEKQYERRLALLNVSNKEAIDGLMQLFNDHDVTKEDVKTLYEDLNYYRLDTEQDKELVGYFEQRIKTETNIDISRPEVVDHASRQKQRNQQSFDLLFDKEAFETEVRRLYSELGIAEPGFNDLWEFSRNNHAADAEEFFVRCVLDLLREWTRNRAGVSLQEVIDWMHVDGEFEEYAMREASQRLKNYNEIEVSPAQQKVIEEWSNTAMQHVHAGDLITVSDEHSFSVNGRAMIVWFFLYKLSIKLTEEILRRFTIFVDVDKRNLDYAEFDVLRQHLSKPTLDQQVKDNLAKGIRY